MEGDVPASWREYAKQKGIDIDGFTPEQVHRQQVIHEMILTEFSYCQDLRLIIDEFANVLRTQFKGALNVEQMDIVFQNIEEILPVNLSLAQDLEARRQESLVVERIGDIYKEYIPRMAVYTPYLCQFTKAQDMVIECDKPGSKFHAFLEDRHLNCAATNGLDLMSMLIKPCQRICKYPLLIRDLLKSTSEDSADIDDLLEAAEGFNLILDEMNDTKRRREMAVRARELTVLIEKGVEMGLARRKFIKEGDVVQFDGKKMLDRTLVLFGDFLVVVKKKNEKKYTLKLQFNLSEILVSEEPDSARILDAIKLIHGPNVYIFAFVDSDEKGEWLGELNYWIDICLEEQLREHKKLKRMTIGPSTMSNFDVSMFSGEAFGSDDVRRKLEEKNGPKAIGSSPRNLPLPPAPNRGGSSSARTSRRNSLVRDEISGPVLVAATKETDDTKFIDLSGGEPRSVPARGKNLPPPPPRAGGRAPASTGGMSTRDKALPPPPPGGGGGGGNNVNNNKGTGPPLAAPARRRAETEQPGAAPPRVGYDKPLPTPGEETGGDSTTDEPVSRRQSVGKGLASILNSLPSIPAWRSKSGSSASDAAPASEYGSTNLDSPRSARSLPPPPPDATPRRPTSTSSASGAMPSRTASPLPPTPPQTTSSQKGVSSASSSPLPPTPGKAGSGKALPPQPPGESSASGSSNNSTNNATVGKALPPQPPGAAESPASGSANNSGNKSTLGVSAGSGKALPPQPPGGGESPASVSSNNSANKTAAGAGKALPPQPPCAGDTTNNNPLPSLPPTPGAKALPPQPPPSSAKPTLSVPLSNKGIGKGNKVGGGTGNNASNNGALPALPTPPGGKTAGGSVSNRPTLPPTPDRSTKAASANPLPTPPKSPGRGPNPLQAPARGAPPPPPASAKPNPSTLPIPPTQQQQQQQQIIGVSGVGGVSGGGKLPPPPIDRSQKQPQNLHRRTNSSGSAPAMRRWNSSDSVGSEARGLSQVGHANRAVDAYGGGGGVQQQQRGHVRGASEGKSLPPPPGGALPATPAGPPPVPTIAKPKIGPPPPERDDSLSWAAQESATAGAPPPPSRPPPKRDVQAIGFGQRSLAVRNPRTGRVRSNSTGTNLTALEAARNGWREGVAPSGRVRRGIPIDPTTGKPPPPTNPPPSRTRAGTGNSIPTDPLAYGGRTGGPGLGLSMPKGQQGAGAGSGSGSGSGAGGMPVQSVNSGGTGRTGGPGLGLNMPNGQQGGAPNPPRGGPMPGSAPTTPMGGVGGLPPTPNNNNNNSNNNTYDNNNNNNNGGGRLPPTPTGEAVGAMPAQPAGQGGVAPWDRQRAGQRKRMIGSILNAQESERATVADRMKGFGFVERRTSVFVASRMAEPTAESTAADEDTPDGKVYAYDYLRTKPRILHLNLLPFYLSRAEFRSVFGVDKDTFRGLPSWKQEMLRKKHGLF